MKLLNFIKDECVLIDGYYLCDIVIYKNKLRAQIFDISESGKITMLNYAVHINVNGDIFIKVNNGWSSKVQLKIKEYLSEEKIKMVYDYYNFDPEDKKKLAEIRKEARKICDEWLENLDTETMVYYWNIAEKELKNMENANLVHFGQIRNYMIRKWAKNKKIEEIGSMIKKLEEN
jgi:hypothetical protein